MIDGEEEKEVYFDLVHREVFERGKPHAEASLQVPPQFSMECTGSHETDLLEDRGLVYVDKSYRLTLRNKDYGLNKSVVRLNGLGDGGIVESAIVWQRSPYLSSIPAELHIGTRSLRAFLRCPDEAVELTRVLSAPAGIKAVVSSPREITVMAENVAPETIDGVVEVGTTATDRPPLRIPVTRYAPAVSHSGGGL